MSECTGCPPACFRPGTKVLVVKKKAASNAVSPTSSVAKASFAEKAIKELQGWFSEAGKRIEYSLSGFNLKSLGM